jgi:hypothetical protein
VADLREIIKNGCSEKDVVAKFVNQLKQKDLLVSQKHNQLVDLERLGGLTAGDVKRIDKDLTNMHKTGRRATLSNRNPDAFSAAFGSENMQNA